ncbi:PEP-utilizing enzyme [Pseudonocardia acidicola]|uniref:Phosphoenolpyruvate-utilizing protein n=1 Tax=Pseudonocardia acidicola TaxID=2724939 RepID=A0ABX1S9J7_9PSEU|nr:PEP-utilizing enzyme [Pseudonocardia acidicola]NMH98243.1 phosphoenolpyruvate-utilizing protein [Pseudonocardia acidicola]
MVDITKPWVVDTPLSEQYPIYTRSNVAEVAPNPATPLMWTCIGGLPGEHEWRRALVEFGAFDLDEFDPDRIEIQGLVHGYLYLNVSIQRIFGVRMPGASPDLIDRTYFGNRHVVRPYDPRPQDSDPKYTERIMASIGRLLSGEGVSGFDDDAAAAARVREERPDLASASERELLERFSTVLDGPYRPVARKHYSLVYESSVATGMLTQALAPLEDPSLEVRLISGYGGVDSAAPSYALWDLSRLVAASPDLTAEFAAGAKGVAERLRSLGTPEADRFLEEFATFQRRFGSRGTDEWEICPQTWETHPELPLGMVDRMRLQPDDRAPGLRAAQLRAEREELEAQVRERLAGTPEALAAFDTAAALVARIMLTRERSKTTAVRLMHEARMAVQELGRRYAAAGHFSRLEDISMVRRDELEALVADPASFRDAVAERRAWYEQLDELDPPFIVDGTPPPVSTWPKKKEPAVEVARSGDILAGLAACPGVVTGPARIVHDPEDAAELQPGEILVARMTDPGWTPLFVSAAAVVVSVGATLSHAAIVSRELGIPCVVGVEHAQKRIADGTILTVDGTAGLVTVA